MTTVKLGTGEYADKVVDGVQVTAGGRTVPPRTPGWKPPQDTGPATSGKAGKGGDDVEDLTTLQRVADRVVRQHADSPFIRLIALCQSLPQGTDFGRRMGKEIGEFADLCVALGRAGGEVAEQAPAVARMAERIKGS